MIPNDTIPIAARRYTSVHGGRREEARSQRHGVQIRLRWGRGTTEKCDFEAKFFSARRPLFHRPGLDELEKNTARALRRAYPEGVCSNQLPTASP